MKKVNNKTGVRQFTLDDQDFMQAAYVEAFASLIKERGGIYILHGLQVSGSASPYTVSAGAIAYDGEIYQYEGGTSTDANPFVYITVTHATYDPVMYRDGSTQNTYNDRKISFTDTAGTALGSLSSIKRAFENFEQNFNLSSSKLFSSITAPSGVDVGGEGSVIVQKNVVKVSGYLSCYINSTSGITGNNFKVEISLNSNYQSSSGASTNNRGIASCYRTSDIVFRPSICMIESGKLVVYLNHGGLGGTLQTGQYLLSFYIEYVR